MEALIKAGKSQANRQRYKIFSQTPVNGLSKTENVLHNPVGMLHLAAYGRFSVFNIPLPVNGIV